MFPSMLVIVLLRYSTMAWVPCHGQRGDQNKGFTCAKPRKEGNARGQDVRRASAQSAPSDTRCNTQTQRFLFKKYVSVATCLCA